MTTVYYLLARLLPTSTVDRAVRAITRAATALAAAEAAQNERAMNLTDQISNLRDQRSAALAEGARAARIRERLNTLTA